MSLTVRILVALILGLAGGIALAEGGQGWDVPLLSVA